MSSELRRLWEQAGGKIPDDWRIVPFESLFRDNKSIAVGVMYPGANTVGGAPLLKVGDIKDGLVPEEPSYYISAATNEEHKRTQLVGDELLITLVGNPGECVVATRAMAGWNPARAIAVVRLRDPSLRTYLKTVLESTPSKHLIDAVLNTTVQKTLNLKDVRQLPIPLPPMSVIEDISSIADSLIQRIALLRETNATLEAIAQALFKSWFVDFDPVHAKAQGIAPEGMDEATAALFPDSFEESELGLVPMGWQIRKAETLLTRLKTKVRFTKEQVLPSGSTPVYEQGAGILLGYHDGQAQFTATPNEPMFIFGDHTCVMHLSCEPFDISMNVIPLQACDRPTLWTYYAVKDKQVFQEYRRHWMELAVKDVVVAPIAICKKFSEVVSVLHVSTESNARQSNHLASLRDTLLPRLISGQLRIPDVEGVTL